MHGSRGASLSHADAGILPEMPKPVDIRAKRREIAVRYAWMARDARRKRIVTPRNAKMAALRLADLARLFSDRYGPQFPDDDAGLADLELMLHHIAHLRDPEPKMVDAIATRAPWLPIAKAMTLRCILDKPHAWTADELARRLNLTAADRARHKITTIGAIDAPKEQRATRRRKLKRLREAKRRHAKGAQRRVDYEAGAASRLKPWEAEGISRATWYRRRETGPCPA